MIHCGSTLVIMGGAGNWVWGCVFGDADNSLRLTLGMVVNLVMLVATLDIQTRDSPGIGELRKASLLLLLLRIMERV